MTEKKQKFKVEADPKDQIKQPHLDNSNIKNTEWKDLY